VVKVEKAEEEAKRSEEKVLSTKNLPTHSFPPSPFVSLSPPPAPYRFFSPSPFYSLSLLGLVLFSLPSLYIVGLFSSPSLYIVRSVAGVADAARMMLLT
jgi:hypothetical protein